MQLSIVSLPPLLPGQKPGCSGDMPQDLQKSVSPQTRDLPRTVPWISLSVKLNIRVRYTSDQGAQSYVVGTYQGIFKNPPPPPTSPASALVPWTSQSSKLNLQASLCFLRVVGTRGYRW